MKKIIIISYYSKPSNFIGAERIKGWLSYLPKNGIYPVLITRFWDENQNDTSKNNISKENKIEKHKNYEIHRVSLKYGLRDSLIRKNKFIFIRKILSLSQIIFNNLIFTKSEYYPFFTYVDQFLKNNKEFETVIVSGTPFHSFSIGYNIKKRYPNINWHPDYRDQWTTHPFKPKLTFIEKLIFGIESKKELKWTSNSCSFIAVSEDWRDRIQDKIEKPGFVVKNGFDSDINQIKEQDIPRKKGEITISYIGSIYPYQDFEKLLDVISHLNETKNVKIKINFIGIDAYHDISSKIKQISKNYSELIFISKRIPSEELEHIYAQSDLLWLTSFGEMQGWYPVKLFDYASTGIPILLYPSDNDVMEKFIKQTRTGYSFTERSKLEKWLLDIINSKLQIKLKIDKTELKKYTRENQAKNLVTQINNISQKKIVGNEQINF